MVGQAAVQKNLVTETILHRKRGQNNYSTLVLGSLYLSSEIVHDIRMTYGSNYEEAVGLRASTLVHLSSPIGRLM